MSTTFPRTRKSRLGYNIDQVEDFLEEARRAYADQGPLAVVSSASIRHTAFALQRGGYATGYVDAALERLEDAFASRERDRARATTGDAAWYARARASAQEILDRLARPAGKRFSRSGAFKIGYDRAQVDAFTDRLVGYFQHGKPMSVDQVRTVVFKSKKRGYSEAQVDLLLDAVIDVMLAVR